MDDSRQTSTNRRRRALWWGLFGVTGLAMATVYASGYASSDSGVATGASPDVFGDPVSDQSPSPYAGFLSSPEVFTIGFSGDWGVVAADYTVFKVDLSTAPAGTYYVDILVNNVPDFWSSLQLKWVEAVDVAAVAACAGASPDTVDFSNDYATPVSNTDHEPKLMNVTTQDSHVSFGGLASGSTYCFGIADIAQADDTPNGTVLVRQSGSTPNAPDFTAIVNRSA